MVDVKLDVRDSPSSKAAFHKKNSRTGIGGVLMYLLLTAAVSVLTFDAADLISLGIVKRFLGLRVMRAEELVTMTAAYETQLAEKEQLFNAISSERDDLLGQVKDLTDERNIMSQAGQNKENEINSLTGERDAVAGDRDALKKQLDDVIAERVQLTEKIEHLENSFG